MIYQVYEKHHHATPKLPSSRPFSTRREGKGTWTQNPEDHRPASSHDKDS